MEKPFVTFCMSTYRRPQFLESQLRLLLSQTFTDFEIVVSDNDPDESGADVSKKINDPRVKYFSNAGNLGMIPSFNKSIERATSEFIVMVTDDDPVQPNFLSEMKDLYESHPGYSLYAGFSRSISKDAQVEIIDWRRFVIELLDPLKTPWLLWSSCMITKESAAAGIPDYGSPHLADHALLAIAGAHKGGVIINKRYSSLTSHSSNYSKSNFDNYINGCKGFYKVMNDFCASHKVAPESMDTVRKHLYHWFVGNVFNLKRYYTATKPDKLMLNELDNFVQEILSIDFMQGVKTRYQVKNTIFKVKKSLGLLQKN